MFYNCDRRNNRDEVKQQMADQSETSTNSENTTPAENMPVLTPTNDAGNTNGEIRENNINGESSNDIADHGNLEEMEIEKWAQGFKRQFAVDSSDSDSKAHLAHSGILPRMWKIVESNEINQWLANNNMNIFLLGLITAWLIISL